MPLCSLLTAPQAIHSRGRIPSFFGINSMCNHVNYVSLLVSEYSAIMVWERYEMIENDLTSCLKDRMIMSEMDKTWRKVWFTLRYLVQPSMLLTMTGGQGTASQGGNISLFAIMSRIMLGCIQLPLHLIQGKLFFGGVK